MTEPFKKEYEPTSKVSKGLKIGNERSSVAKAVEEKKKIEKQFEESAKELITDMQDSSKKMFELSKNLISFLKSSVLEENKSPLVEEVERSNRVEITKLALEIDNDDSNETLNLGSMATIQVIFKGLFILRDRLNEGLFKQSKLEKQVELLTAEVDRLKK